MKQPRRVSCTGTSMLSTSAKSGEPNINNLLSVRPKKADVIDKSIELELNYN